VKRIAASSRRPPLARLLGGRELSRPAAEKILRAHGFRDARQILAALPRLCATDPQRHNLRLLLPKLARVCAASADPDRAFINFERLASALPHPGMFYHYLLDAPDALAMLVTVFAHSQALSDTLARNAEYFHFLISPETLREPRAKSWLDAELVRLLLASRVSSEQYDIIRRFRRRETLRIGARDLVGRASVGETTLELANLADVCLQAVFTVALDKLAAQFKLDADARATAGAFSVIGMGKLGGQELNYSSDVDVIFIYDADGALTPSLSRREFFTKLAEEIVRAVGQQTDEGGIFRIDLRLRPEGASGPLAWSLADCENYYAGRGETWERMALLKARPVAGDAALGRAFLGMVEPFVYSRHSGENVVQQMAAIKKRIEREIVTDDRLTRHVKLGIGGIREIEFIIQSFQVLCGARRPALRERGSLRALPLLVKANLLAAPEADALAAAYRFLRNVEHRLQMEMELQTHTIPNEEQALVRLARSLGFRSVENFFAAQRAHTADVRRIYEAVLADADQRVSPAAAQLADDKLPDTLRNAGFSDVVAAQRIVANLLHGSGFIHISQRTKELFAGVFATALDCCRKLPDPDAALLQFDKFVGAYGSRGLLYEVLLRQPKLTEVLLKLGDASLFFSETLQREPGLFDELCRGGALNQPKNIERMCEDLVAAAMDDRETPPLDVARRWKRAEMLRVGIEDVMGLVDVEHLCREMSVLAEATLRFALHQARRDQALPTLPFAVIAMGKFGGEELGYGADLDVLFVGGTGARDQAAAIRLAAKMIEYMSAPTAAGTIFPVDARLRPDGEKGVLASSIEAHADYYRARALLWEKLALTRARFVAGNEPFGRKFMEMVHGVIYAGPITDADFEELRQMRRRIETERGDQSRVELEFKTGPGGLVDVEFLAQAMQLRHGHAHPALRSPHTLATLNRLTALGFVGEHDCFALHRHYLFLRRIESVLRRAENASVSRLPAGDREQALLAKRLGFAAAADLLGAYRIATREIRAAYERNMK
jgi:glutamate-ammonia-ligase adenylyltransferase